MELWIRTYPKKGLVKVNDIVVFSREGMYSLESKDFVLGMYKTEERALEVLDEIQKRIIKISCFVYRTDSYCLCNNDFVYEMPKE